MDIRTLPYSFPAPQRVANHGISSARDAIPAALRMEICGNDGAAEMLRQLERQTRWRYAALDLMDDRHRRQILSTWRGMADALAARDPDTAESIAKRMIRQYQEIVLPALECDDLTDGVGAARPFRSSSRNPDRQRA
jgi:hypothetical protein